MRDTGCNGILRNYIITEPEKKIIQLFLEQGYKLEGFSVLKNRLFKAYPNLIRNMILVARFFYGLEDEAPEDVNMEVLKAREEWRAHLKNRDRI